MPVLEFRGTLLHCTTVGELDVTLHGLFENDLAIDQLQLLLSLLAVLRNKIKLLKYKVSYKVR